MLTLTIQHNIYLTKNDRYALHEGESIDTIGVSIPVWHQGNKTSEPAKEIFCNYYLRNPKKEIPIKVLEDGYLLNIPHRIPNRIQREVEDAEWLQMTQEQREAYYTSRPKEMSSASLLDIKDGGSESLMYKETNTVKTNGKFMKISHYINIYDIKYLERKISNAE